MKKNLTQIMLGLGLAGSVAAQNTVTGPSSSQTPYLQPIAAGSTITSVFTVTNSVGGYTMVGIPDGLGAFDNNDGTFTLLMNHEFGSGGATHAHGANGAFVSKWKINKSNLSVVSGADLIQNVYLWTGTTYTMYNSTNPSTLTAFGRFCSGDLAAATAFYNASTGKGTQARIYMNGEETGNEGRALGHIASGANAGDTYELPYLGKASWENYVACPYPQDKTIVIGMDDTSPLGQVYVYIGTKATSGTDIVKAGLNGGKLYGVAVVGLLNEVTASFPPAGTAFNLIDLGTVQGITGTQLNTNSNNVGVTNFLRPEDGAWDPSNPNDFYFNTTDAFASPSRLWKLHFTNIAQPELGGTITAVLDGTEGQKMLDNMAIDHYGNIMLVEDVGSNAHNGKVWNYNIASDAMTLYAQHDTTRFITGGANFLTIDEEATGIVDMQEILGPGMFLTSDQAHYAIASPVLEGGQLMALYNKISAMANPEINVQGNAVNIPSGNTAISAGDNTNFGSVNMGSSVLKTFVIQNAGPGPLSVTGFSMGGANAGDFTFPSLPFLPTTVPVNGNLTVQVVYNPALLGTSNGKIYVKNNDFDEPVYSFAIQGTGVAPEINVQGNSITILDGNTVINTTDNTDFGTTYYNDTIVKTFNIQNTGTGTLTLSNMGINGNNSSMFTFVNAPTFPVVLAPSASQTFAIQYLPVVVATNTAMVMVSSNDMDESAYDFMIQGKAEQDVGIRTISKENAFVSLYPNPAKDEATIRMKLENNAHVMVTVFDIQGKVVMSSIEKNMEKGEREITLNTVSLKTGEYFVQISTGNKTEKIKMVVIH